MPEAKIRKREGRWIPQEKNMPWVNILWATSKREQGNVVDDGEREREWSSDRDDWGDTATW